MRPREWFQQHLKKYANDPEYELEGVILEITEQIARELAKQKVTRAELAKRLGVSKPYVSKVLNGMPNLTLAKMVQISRALGCKFKVEISPKQSQQGAFHVTELLQQREYRRKLPVTRDLQRLSQPYDWRSLTTADGQVIVFNSYDAPSRYGEQSDIKTEVDDDETETAGITAA